MINQGITVRQDMIYHAIEAGHIDIVKYLIEYSRIHIDKLHILKKAIYFRQTEIVNYLWPMVYKEKKGGRIGGK